jgi:amidohydrolase
MSVLEKIDSFKGELVDIRRDIHAHPEIGFEEVRTSAIVIEKLKSYGVEVHTGFGKTGVIGIIRGTKGEGKMIGVRADMDALPMDETTNLPYSSKVPGKFHGCGHDGHTTMLLGAARYLAANRDFAGTAVMIFQPAEEGLGGARQMIADGLFEKFPCDEIYGMHNSPNGKPFEVEIKPGAAMAGADFFDIYVTGVGSHAAMPEHSKDPIVAATALVQALQSIVSRNVKPLKSAVLSVTQIHAGTAYNVVPEKATITGTVRFLDREVGKLVKERMESVCKGIAATYDVEVRLDHRNAFDVLMNTEELVAGYAEAAADIVGAENVFTDVEPVMGSEDFADMLAAAPGVYCRIGHGGTVPVHNPGFTFDDNLLPVGAAIMARIVERRLGAA